MREKIIENGSLVKPVVLSTKNDITVTSGFGPRLHPKKKIMHNHTGIDVTSRSGLAIVELPDSYEITYDEVNGLRFLGRYNKKKYDLYIVHLMTYLGYTATYNNRKVLIVGVMGTSGSSTGPHYHIELRIEGQLHNPTDMVTNLRYPLISL